MTNRRRRQYERLLRWYPAGWYRTHAAVVLDTLEENADRLGQARPTLGEGWSMRAHGIAERASAAVVMIVAAAGLIFSLDSVIVVFAGVVTDDPWSTNARLTVQFFGLLLISTAAGAMLLRAGRIVAEAALVAWGLSALAWALGGAAVASWGVGFDEADAEASRSWFSAAFPLFAGAAWLFGSCALFLVAFGLLRALRSRVLRVILAVLLAVPNAFAVGLAAAMPTGGLLSAAVVVVFAGFQLRRRPVLENRVVPVPGVLLRKQRNRIATLATMAALLGAGCVVFSLTGSVWAPAVGDSTDAMRVGILIGSLVAIITVVAGAEVMVNRRGRVALGPAAAAIGALLAIALSYSLSIDSPFGWPLVVLAAVLAGLTGGLLLAPVLPGPASLRALLVSAISIALAGALGLLVVTAVAFFAPLLGVILAVSMVRRPRRAQTMRNMAPPFRERGLGRSSL